MFGLEPCLTAIGPWKYVTSPFSTSHFKWVKKKKKTNTEVSHVKLPKPFLNRKKCHVGSYCPNKKLIEGKKWFYQTQTLKT